MPPRVRPPSEADAPSVSQVIVARDFADQAELAVARRARRRGLGRALLLGLFAAFRASGREHADLGVHGRHRRALARYESVSMSTTREAERWEKALGQA